MVVGNIYVLPKVRCTGFFSQKDTPSYVDGHPYQFQYAFVKLSMGVLFPKGILPGVGLARFLPHFVCKIFFGDSWPCLCAFLIDEASYKMIRRTIRILLFGYLHFTSNKIMSEYRQKDFLNQILLLIF